MITIKTNQYLAPQAEVLALSESGVLCSSPEMGATTDNFTIDGELSVEDYF